MDKLKQNGYITKPNNPNGVIVGNWYPKSRPLQIYRKQGKTTDDVGRLADTYWLFEGTSIHVVFGTFWLTGYGYVLLQKDPISFDLNFIKYTLVSNNGHEAVWSKSDGSQTVWTSESNDEPLCEPQSTYVKQYKMLGKKLPGHIGAKECCPNTLNTPNGSISSFSGRAQIRPASTLRSEKYFADTSQYLKSRGQSYEVNNVLSKVPGVLYYDGNNIVWPETPQPQQDGNVLNSSVYKSCATQGKCENATTTIYKPSNSKYAKQGAVTSAERILRLKTEAPVVRMSMTGKKLL